MKNILVPTDFSACANHAMDLGFAFAELHQAKLHFFTCVDLPGNWEEMEPEQKNGFPEKEQLLQNINEIFQSWRDKAERVGLEFEVVISGGDFIKELERKVIEKKADFVVMGSHGVSGKNEYFIGSNTQKAVRKLKVPVFVIKNALQDYTFKNVVFASSFDANEKPTFLRFLDFIKSFSPETIHLLAINLPGYFNDPAFVMKEAMKDFKELCVGFNCKMHFYRELSVDAGIRRFAEEINADLIVVSNHIKHPLKRIFSGSSVEALVNHSETPVLSMDFEETPSQVQS